MECRGLEFTDFAPVCIFFYRVLQSHYMKMSQTGQWTCKGETGTKFLDVDLEDDDWVDYDEKVRQYSILNL